MYVTKDDMDYIKKSAHLLDAYEKKFGERFIAFNYADFLATKEKCAGQIYKETLEKALLDDKPYHIASHRYDVFDH